MNNNWRWRAVLAGVMILFGVTAVYPQKDVEHHFPRKFTLQWGGGVPWVLSQYDMVITLPEDSNRIKAAKALSPATYYLATRDWNGGGPFLRFPPPRGYLPTQYYISSWVPQQNAFLPLDYGSGHIEFFANITRYCKSYKGKQFWQYLGDSLNNWVSWAAFDGVHSDGTWHRPLGTDPYGNQVDQEVDLDSNGVRDYLEHQGTTQYGYRAWEEKVWHEGYNLATKHMRDIWGSDQKLIAGWTIGSYNYITNSGIDTLAVRYMNGSGWEYPFTHNHISAHDYFADYKAICDAWDKNHTQNLPVLKYICVNLGDVNIQGSQYNIDHLKNNFKYVREMIGWGCIVGAYVSLEDCYLTPALQLDHHGSIIGYDEFKLDLGLPTGPAVQTNNCWIRGFDNGAVIMMPFDVPGSRTITLAQVRAATGYSGPYYRFFGAQDTSWNTGSLFDQVTLTQTSYIPYASGYKGYSGDALFLTKARDTAIADIIIDDAPCPTTPGNDPAVLTGGGWTEDVQALSNFAHPAYSSTMNTGGTLYVHGAKSHYTTRSGDYATFTPTIVRAGKYTVYEWHGWVGATASAAAEAQNVPVVIKFGPADTDTARRTVNQRVGYGQWNLLGQWNFPQGTGSYVRFTNSGTDGPMIGDAVRFVPVVTTASPVLPDLPKLEGQIIFDRNNNGGAEPNEPGLAGWVVRLSGPLPASAVSDSAGHFEILNVPNGSYVLRQEIQPLWKQTFPLVPDTVYHITVTGDSLDIVRNFMDYAPNVTELPVLNNWNAISLPLLTSDARKNSLFPSATSFAFSYHGSYVSEDTLRYGAGYWLQFPMSQDLMLAGTPLTTVTVAIDSSWNFIGSIGTPVPVNRISTTPAGLIRSSVWAFTGAYTPVDTLRPGGGYWFRTSGRGSLSLTSSAGELPLSEMGPERLKRLNLIEFRSARGESRRVYFSARREDRDLEAFYQMPPVPPADVFDVRFSGKADGGSMVAALDSIQCTAEIALSLDRSCYPLTIDWNMQEAGDAYELSADGSSPHALTRPGGWSLQAPPKALSLRFRPSSGDRAQAAPSSFQLMQNFPNPFNGETVFKLLLPSAGHVKLEIFNVLGEHISTLLDKEMEEGSYTIPYSAATLTSGVYFYRVDFRAQNGTEFQKNGRMLLIR